MQVTRGRATSFDTKTVDQLADEVMRSRSIGRTRSTRVVDGDPLKGAKKFIARNRKELRLVIGPLPFDFRPRARDYVLDHAADDARTEAAVKDHKSKYLEFHRHYAPNDKGVMQGTAHGALVTASPAVADWLRHRIRMGVFRDIYEDISMMDIPCPEPGCDFSVKNTESGRAKLATHVLEEHYTKTAKAAVPAVAAEPVFQAEPVIDEDEAVEKIQAEIAAKAKKRQTALSNLAKGKLKKAEEARAADAA